MAAATHTHLQVTVAVGTVSGGVFTATSGDTSIAVAVNTPDGNAFSEHELREIGFATQRAYITAADDLLPPGP